ncbi:MAG: hypothetical protein WC869_05165 [Phycisphaerae bacterium]|jgi:hypothetical protein
MQSLVIPPGPARSSLLQGVVPEVHIDGTARYDLQVLTLEYLDGPIFGRATLALQPTDTAGNAVEPSLPPIGSQVCIRPCGGSDTDFTGVIVSHENHLDENGQRQVLVAHHQLSIDLSVAVTSRWQLRLGEPVELCNDMVRFNEGPNGGCSADPLDAGPYRAHYFDASASAKPWTVAAALSYLLATTVPAGLHRPPLSELESLAGEIDLGGLNVTGKTAVEAITEVASRGGLALRAAAAGCGLVFYRPRRDGQRRSVALQPQGALFSPDQTNLWRAAIRTHRSSGPRGLLVLGAPKRYESTFMLSPGWDSSLQTSRWRDFARSLSSDWPLLADVYRKWVLNEHGWYSLSPWNLPVHDFSAVSAADFPLASPRRPLPCLSSDPSGQSLGIVVEFRCGVGAPWRRWRGPLWISQDECAVYFGGDGLGGEYFQAAVAGTVQVRLTCCLDADVRVLVEIPGDPSLSRRVIDASARAQWAKVAAASAFSGRTDLGAPAEQDDTALLEAIAAVHGQPLSAVNDAQLTLAWVDPSWQVGDVVEAIDGRRVPLPSSAAGACFVRAVTHDFVAQTTTLHLEA